MGDMILAIAAFAACVVIWEFFGRHPLGRMVQVLLTAALYAAWLSIIPLTIYFVGNNVAEQLADDSYGKAAFVVIASALLAPILLFPLIPWNYFCQYVWRKAGVKLPQSCRLAGERQYYDSEREH